MKTFSCCFHCAFLSVKMLPAPLVLALLLDGLLFILALKGLRSLSLSHLKHRGFFIKAEM